MGIRVLSYRLRGATAAGVTALALLMAGCSSAARSETGAAGDDHVTP